jgi:hypothetical protein
VLSGAFLVATNVVTCCESQGTRTYGALPEFVYSTQAAKSSTEGNGAAVYVNLFVPSVYHGAGFMLTQRTGFPQNGSVSLSMSRNVTPATAEEEEAAAAKTQQLMLRIPSWCTEHSVPIVIEDTASGAIVSVLTGVPGTYLAVELADTQTVVANFTMGLRVSLYNGTGAPVDSFGCKAKEVVRAAVEWGPVLLAAVYSADPKW